MLLAKPRQCTSILFLLLKNEEVFFDGLWRIWQYLGISRNFVAKTLKKEQENRNEWKKVGQKFPMCYSL